MSTMNFMDYSVIWSCCGCNVCNSTQTYLLHFYFIFIHILFMTLPKIKNLITVTSKEI